MHELVVSDTHWDMVRDEKQREGFDREAYEYSCSAAARQSYYPSALTQRQQQKLQASTFLVKLEGPLQNVSALAKAANMSSTPQETILASDSSGQSSTFCKINGLEKLAIEGFLSGSNLDMAFYPTFIRISIAHKELSANSMYPTLGIDPTLPQHRPSCQTDNLQPAQDDYPIWYFLYGTLAQSDILCELLGTDPVYHDAKGSRKLGRLQGTCRRSKRGKHGTREGISSHI